MTKGNKNHYVANKMNKLKQANKNGNVFSYPELTIYSELSECENSYCSGLKCHGA